MSQSPVRRPAALVLDAVLVVVFATLGARTHHDGTLGVAAVADVAWPFLVGAALAHLLLRGLRRDAAAITSGVVVWVVTLVVGMALRRLTGDGTATAFVLVATGFTLVTLLGWRLVARLLRAA